MNAAIDKLAKKTASVQVLLVEDNPVNLIVARKMLERLHCEVTSAENGRQALEILKQRRFDIIFMDCQMPEMDGYETTRTLRQMEKDEAHDRIPIIAVTANAMLGDREQCLEAGMDDYLAKPFKSQALEKILYSWVSAAVMHEAEPSAMPGPDENMLDISILNSMRELLGDKTDSILVKYLEVSEDMLGRIIRAVDQEDEKLLREAAHSLKSCSAQVGAVRIAKMAGEIEALALQGKPGGAKVLCGELALLFSPMKKAISQQMSGFRQQS